jgi:enoyl-CoA hydratase
VSIDIETSDSVAIVRVRAGRANAMSAALLKELEATFADVGARKDIRSVVLTGEGSAFSAGLALPELIQLDRAGMRDFIAAFERAMQRVLTHPRAVVAAINGHAIAGGCVLALMCDVRIAALGTAKVGLNEVQLGIGLPSLVVEPLRARVPASSLLPIAYEGRLLGVEEAKGLGLIDAVVPSAELENVCIARARELGRSIAAYAQIKAALLRPVLEAITRNAPNERESWLDSWFSAEAQATLKATVERLQKK